MKITPDGKHHHFFQDVYEVTRLIPFGRVTSYGAIAAYLGAKGSARMVGWAMNAAHTLDDVPAHRVVNSKGLLSGKHHFCSPTEMEERLANEGIKVADDKIENFKVVFWNPLQEL